MKVREGVFHPRVNGSLGSCVSGSLICVTCVVIPSLPDSSLHLSVYAKCISRGATQEGRTTRKSNFLLGEV